MSYCTICWNASERQSLGMFRPPLMSYPDSGPPGSHFLDTGHTYTMRVGSTRVWDYVGDNFVHRLVQNKEDGKMVEVEDGVPGQQGSKHVSQGQHDSKH